MAATELLPNVTYNNHKVVIVVCQDAAYNGHVDHDNSEEGFPNMLNTLLALLRQQSYALLTLNNITVAVHSRQESNGMSYWLLDSHARDSKGCKAPARGTSCCIRSNNINDMHNIIRRNLYVGKNTTAASALALNIY